MFGGVLTELDETFKDFTMVDFTGETCVHLQFVILMLIPTLLHFSEKNYAYWYTYVISILLFFE